MWSAPRAPAAASRAARSSAATFLSKSAHRCRASSSTFVPRVGDSAYRRRDSRPGVDGGSVADSSRAATRSRTASTRLGMASAISRAASAASAAWDARAAPSSTRRPKTPGSSQRVARRPAPTRARGRARGALVVVQSLLEGWSFSSHVARRCGPARPAPPGRTWSALEAPDALDTSRCSSAAASSAAGARGLRRVAALPRLQGVQPRAVRRAPPLRVPEPPDQSPASTRASRLLAGELARALDGRRLLGEGRAVVFATSSLPSMAPIARSHRLAHQIGAVVAPVVGPLVERAVEPVRTSPGTCAPPARHLTRPAPSGLEHRPSCQRLAATARCCSSFFWASRASRRSASRRV